MGLENIYKLFTKEDVFHFHKVLGFACLTNFFYRFWKLMVVGDIGLVSYKDIITIQLHGLLSISSLVFPLSKKRHKSLTIIYPEFRLHSILFALRSVVCIHLIHYNYHKIFNIFTCLLVNVLADLVAQSYKNEHSTMRNMPFHPSITETDARKITRGHSCSQIGATLYMLGNTNTAFFPLIPIQLAAFLMTLTRKNIITPNTWHIVYSITLWLNIFPLYTLPISDILWFFSAYLFFDYWRLIQKKPKYVGWIIVYVFYLFFLYFSSYLNDIPLKKFIKVSSFAYFTYYKFNEFKILL